jgi:two-component system phosphate regulon sensor histidine kinase PhoR
MKQQVVEPGSDRSSFSRALRRLVSSRRLVMTVVSLILILLIVGEISAIGAAVGVVGLLVAALSSPAPGLQSTETEPPTPSAASDLPPGTRLFADSLPSPCFILDADGGVRYANARARGLFDIEVGERLPLRLRYPELLDAFARLTRGDGPQQVQFVERVPTERWFSAWLGPLQEHVDHPDFVLILEDQTEARATERMRVDFVANASHELRTPLASLSGFVETLQGPARDDVEAREKFLGMMHEQALRMSRLIEDLLSLSRVELRAHVRPNQPVDLTSLIRHVADTMVPLAEDLGVVLKVDLPATPVLVPGDRDELVQVFCNLVENGCKYGQSGGRVEIRLETNGDRAPISASVIDFGPGILPEHLPRLTERFYRVDADESRRHRGTGLGLAIVKHIVGRHRARLQIESQSRHGAQFIVLFPESISTDQRLNEKRQ